MQIVIEIPDEDAQFLMESSFIPVGYFTLMHTALHEGIVLSKGHGDLVSRNDVIHSLFDYVNGKKTIGECVDKVKAVIPADKGDAE